MPITKRVVNVPGNAGTATKLANDTGEAPSYSCRAWVKFSGASGVPVIAGSANVSSITDNGVGRYTINFATPMPDANYLVLPCAGTNTGYVEDGAAFGCVICNYSAPVMTANGVKVMFSITANGTGYDVATGYAGIGIFR